MMYEYYHGSDLLSSYESSSIRLITIELAIFLQPTIIVPH